MKKKIMKTLFATILGITIVYYSPEGFGYVFINKSVTDATFILNEMENRCTAFSSSGFMHHVVTVQECESVIKALPTDAIAIIKPVIK